MVIILDRNLATERSFDIDTFNERPYEKTLNANKIYIIESSQDFPQLDFGEKSFTTITILDGSIQIPLLNQYNTIKETYVNYIPETKEYTVYMTFVEE